MHSFISNNVLVHETETRKNFLNKVKIALVNKFMEENMMRKLAEIDQNIVKKSTSKRSIFY